MDFISLNSEKEIHVVKWGMCAFHADRNPRLRLIELRNRSTIYCATVVCPWFSFIAKGLMFKSREIFIFHLTSF